MPSDRLKVSIHSKYGTQVLAISLLINGIIIWICSDFYRIVSQCLLHSSWPCWNSHYVHKLTSLTDSSGMTCIIYNSVHFLNVIALKWYLVFAMWNHTKTRNTLQNYTCGQSSGCVKKNMQNCWNVTSHRKANQTADAHGQSWCVNHQHAWNVKMQQMCCMVNHVVV